MNDYQNDFLYQEQQQVTEGQVATYVAKVMGWMCVGLLTTFVTTLLALSSTTILSFLFSSTITFYGIFFLQLGVVIAMSAAVNKISATAATVMFMAYSVLTGLTLTVIAFAFDLYSIMSVFLLTAFIFLTMAVFGYVTKKDMTRIGSLCMFALLGIILAGVINMFIGSMMLDFIISCVGIVLFIALIAYDTQKIKGFYVQAVEGGYGDDSQMVRKGAIFGALTLYLDFINLFLRLLSIMGRRRN